MTQDSNGSRNAPSSDTTSALFVSARKKQLAEQEAEERARAQERKRVEAEAEVRRLEQEVEDRRRKAQEESERIAAEAAAQQAKAARAAAAAPAPGAAAAAPAPAPGGPGVGQRVKSAFTESGGDDGDGGGKGKGFLGLSTRGLAIAGGALAAVILLVVVLVVVGGGGKAVTLDATYTSSQKALSFSYPKEWTVDDSSAESVTIISADENVAISVIDATRDVEWYVADGLDPVSAVEAALDDLVYSGGLGEDMSGVVPELSKSGDDVSGHVAFSTDLDGTPVDVIATVETVQGRYILILAAALNGSDADAAFDTATEIIGTMQVGALEWDDEADGRGDAVDGGEVSEDARLAFVVPEGGDWSAEWFDEAEDYAVGIVSPSGYTGVLVNYTARCEALFGEDSTATGEDVLDDFLFSLGGELTFLESAVVSDDGATEWTSELVTVDGEETLGKIAVSAGSCVVGLTDDVAQDDVELQDAMDYAVALGY